MKFIKVIDTAFIEKQDRDGSFIVVVDDNEYELLKSDLDHILSNQDDYEDMGVYEAMMRTISDHGASLVNPDFSLEW